ncbi:MAG: fused MFS/spermidine synthase [Chloroflexi bacterium]|nr:fused MFS/spermidine synthase [Chloroflexota bacterium]
MWRAGGLVFAASCATLVLELVAGRLLSPFIGVSLYTWTSIIGLILAGISLGNWLGGRVADRYPSPRTLGLLFLLGGLCTLGVLGLLALLGDGSLVRPIPLLARIFVLTSVVFLPPSFLLGTITPLVIKLALPDVQSTGRIVGLIYALGTLGSLVGNFLTGFVLVAYLPVGEIVLGVGVALLLLGLLGGEWWGQHTRRATGMRHAPAGAAGGAHEERHRPRATTTRRGRLHLRGNVALASAVAAIASFCSMAIELAASRVLAPYVGVSLYSWTGIIGVVLAGIALGNYLGGRIADRWPRQRVLGVCLFLGGLASLSILVSVVEVTQAGLFNELGLMERIVDLTAAIFFVPVLLLGTISPQVIRLAITDLGHAGRVSGRIYAWSTAGAIVGTFATGWWLISLLGVYPLILGAGLGLIGLAIAVGRFWRSALALVASLAVAAAAVYGLSARGALDSPCGLETNYFCIKVLDDVRDGQPVKSLVLDHLIHSYVKLGDPSYLGYEHEQVQAEVTRFVAARAAQPHVLVIGGGGYTYPRWVEAFVPSASVEVVEIDPGVTEVVYRDLGLARDTRIVSHNLDGRQFVHELALRKHYHLVVQDAVNDLSVPYHILTKEYNDYIRAVLTDDGIYLLTVIDLYRDGQLLRSAIRTMLRTFPSVQLLAASPTWTSGGSSVFVISGSSGKLDLEAMRQALRSQGVDPMRTVAQPDDELRAYVDAGPQIVLTDQYAPVDNLISTLFARRN